MQELLQRFHDVKFMSNLDLTSAFWQVLLKNECRKYAAFLFDATQYQFRRVPYGFRNNLSALVRALKRVLGFGSEEFVICYVDDLVVFFQILPTTSLTLTDSP
jgi:hypothetical protein